MSAATLTLRVMVATITVIVLGVMFVFGFTVMEPFYQSLGEPPAALDWGTPGSTTLTFAATGMIGLLLVLIIWFVAAPIREDRRQQFR